MKYKKQSKNGTFKVENKSTINKHSMEVPLSKKKSSTKTKKKS